MTRKLNLSKYIKLFSIILPVIAFISLTFILFTKSPMQLKDISAEGNIIEVGTFLFLLISGGTLFYFKRGLLGSILILCALREADLHKFMGQSFLKNNFYTEPGMSTTLQKIIGLILISLIAFVVIKSIIKYVKPFIKNLLNFQTYYSFLFINMGLFALGKFLDIFCRLYKKIFDVAISENSVMYIGYIEESIELMFALLIFTNIILYFLNKKANVNKK